MKLEDEIQQKKFATPRAKLVVNLIYTCSWHVHQSAVLFKQFDITSQQYNILRILRGHYPNPCTIQTLKDRMLDKQSDVSRLVDRLIVKGSVFRKHSDADRRKMDVMITPGGLKLLEKMDPVVATMENHFSNLTNDEVDVMNNLLDKLRG